MAYSSFRKFAILVPVLALTAGVSAQALAGFEWKGPITPPVAPVPVDNTNAPGSGAGAPAVSSPEDPMKGLEPVIKWNGDASPAAMPAVKPASVEKADVQESNNIDSGDVVQGFGSGVPLVIALQQIAPPGYRYSFVSGVNPGETVSWTGGKSWKTVLSDTLAPTGLSYKIQESTIIVGRFDAPKAEAPKEAAAVPAPAAGVIWNAPAESSMPALPAPEAPLALTHPAETRVLLGHASETGVNVGAPTVAAVPPPPQEVNIRRQKPSSILEKWGINSNKPPVEDDGIFPVPAVTAQNYTAAAASPPAAIPAKPVEPVAAPEMLRTPPDVLRAPPAIEKPLPLQREADAAPVPDVPVWRGAKGETLRSVLKNWSDVSGVELYWAIDYDYRLDSDVAFSGTYDEAVGKILDRYVKSRPQPYGQLHQSSDGPRVLVIKSYDLAG